MRGWLHAAWRLWIGRGLDERGLFFERLGFDATPDRGSPRRVLVQGRQVFALGRAAVAGVPGATAALARALPAIAAHTWGVGGAPGWIHVLDAQGRPADLRRDAYDQSFLLLGLAEAVRLGLADAAAMGAAGWRFVDTLHDDVHGGYHEGAPATLPRRSNPHMHLLEAALAWFEVTGEVPHLERANAIAELFARNFFDPERSTLAEFFDAGLGRLADERGASVEPGHMFEWSWLLHRLAAFGGRDLRAEAAALHRWGCAHGLDAAGFAIDESDRDGVARRTTRRAWPQTELIKSALANGDIERGETAAAAFLDTYLATDVAGLWIDRFDAASLPLAADVPASTFYHIVLAFEQMLEHQARGRRDQT